MAVMRAEAAWLAGGGAWFVPVTAHRDARGRLRPIAFPVQDFMPVRAFVVEGKNGAQRGGHGHLLCRQLLLCAAGEVSVELVARGGSTCVRLAPDTPALMIAPGTWSRQTYEGSGTVLLVFADLPYDPADYFTQVPGDGAP